MTVAMTTRRVAKGWCSFRHRYCGAHRDPKGVCRGSRISSTWSSTQQPSAHVAGEMWQSAPFGTTWTIRLLLVEALRGQLEDVAFFTSITTAHVGAAADESFLM